MERRVVDVAAEVEKFAREASKKFGILDDRLENAGGGESLSHMIFHLGEASFDFEACVPSATVGPVEAAWLSRFCVGEGGVDKMGVRHAVHELIGVHIAGTAALRHEAIADRKSVVRGKSVSVSVDRGGIRLIKKKKKD